MSAMKPALSEPIRVMAVEGEVVLLGPTAMAVSLTPEAAEESARRLIAAAEQARTQAPAED